MSRSYRRTPIMGHCGKGSEKKDKRLANRKLRRVNRVRITENPDDMLGLRDVSDPWEMSKDGKSYNPEYLNSKKRLSK